MSVPKKEVDLNLEILELMDQYLAFYEYDGLYTLAEGHEDSFQKLNAALKQYNAGVANMWDYTPEDINNLMGVAFDYIRLNLPQNDIRDIFRKPTQNNGSIFGSKDRWNKFFQQHQENIASFDEKPIEDYIKDATGVDLTACLQARDNEWRKHIEKNLTETFKEAQDEIDSQLRANEPLKLIAKAQGALDSIDSKSQGFVQHGDEILLSLESVIKRAELLKAKINV
jgi:hypothetical protein